MRGILIRLLVIGVIAGGAFLLRDRLSSNASGLAVGDCFDVPEATTIEDVQHHPCSEAHDAEVVFVGDFPAADDAAPPNDDQVQTFVSGSCVPALLAYVGAASPDLENLELGAIYPDTEAWNSGSRKVTCYLYDLNGGKLSKSLKIAS